MARRTPTPGVPIEVAGEARTLRFPAGSIAALEEQQGKSIFEILADLQQSAAAGKLHVKLILEVLVAGLQHEVEFTWRTLGNQVDLDELLELLPDILRALRAAFPQRPAPAAVPAVKAA